MWGQDDIVEHSDRMVGRQRFNAIYVETGPGDIAPFFRGFQIDRRIPHAAGRDEFQVGQPFDDLAGNPRPFAHRAYHFERPQPLDQAIRLAHMVAKRRDVEARPVGNVEREAKRVVEDGDFGHLP